MSWLAIDTTSARLSVAVVAGDGRVAERHLDGPRQHARALLRLVDEALAEAGTTLSSLEGLVMADGPGSFTGLRVSGSVAKALHDALGLKVWVASTLMAQALTPASNRTVLVTTDALRGDVHAAVYRFSAAGVETVVAPVVIPRESAAAMAPHDVVVEDGLADARHLLALRGLAGGAVALDNVSAWVPTYGRQAEAQAKWEREHGRPLAHPPGVER